jgi:hypothetical protein
MIFSAVRSGATVVPFPLARRRAFIDRHARLIATMRPGVGERYLDRQLQVQFENLQRRGIDLEIINREIVAMDAATLCVQRGTKPSGLIINAKPWKRIAKN